MQQKVKFSPENKNDTLIPQDGKSLPLMEDFYTIQGEGYHQGKATYFIRLAGCDVECHWCDVKDSWNASGYPVVDVHSISEKAAGFPSRIAVVTGGEPLMYNLFPLTESLHSHGMSTHIETSGAHPLSGDWDWICLSPKKFKPHHPSVTAKADELKVIVYNKSDLAWAEELSKEVRPDCKFFLQPEWSKQNEVLPLIIEYIKNNPRWEISLQIHKYLNIP